MAFENEKKTGDAAVEIRKRKEKIKGKLSLFSGSPAILEVSLRDICVCATAGEVQSAQNRPMDEERIRCLLYTSSPKMPEKIEYVLVNGAECEPYLTSNHRKMLDEPGEIIEGLRIMLTLFENAKGYICLLYTSRS